MLANTTTRPTLILIAALSLVSCTSYGYVNADHPQPGSDAANGAKETCDRSIGGQRAFGTCNQYGECVYGFSEKAAYESALNRCMSNHGWKRIEM